VRGTPDNPVADGVAHVHRAVLAAPWLPRPMTGFGATVRLNSNVLSVESLEGHTGRKGKLSVQGALSLAPQRADTWAALVAKAKTTDGIQVKVENLEVRVCDERVRWLWESVMSEQGGPLEPLAQGSRVCVHSGQRFKRRFDNGAPIEC